MPYFMDRHELSGATAAEVAAYHLRDLEVQGRYDVQYVNYWFDYDRQTAFCLARGPDQEAVNAVHREAHGLVATDIVEVDYASVELFLGRILGHPPGEEYEDKAFRAILFTDLEGSTRLTQQLGDAGAMAHLRRHDDVVRGALGATGGREVKHTGDGLMASFAEAEAAVRCAVLVQQVLAEPSSGPPIAVRIGVAAGEPLAERGDLFGTAVQLAARLCARAAPGSVLVSADVRDLAVGSGVEFRRRQPMRLKGFAKRVLAYEVAWASAAGVAASPH
jgi:class 3 adenylate cyclase